MNRQGKEPESQIVLKRPCQENKLAQHSSSIPIPSSIAPSVHGIDISPAIRGVQDHMSTWMSSLIHAQDGCLQMVAQRVSMGRIQQEQLAQQVAQRSMMPSMTDQVSYLRAQLAHRDAQLEQVKAERDNHFVQEEEVLAHMRLLSSETEDWKSRVVTETEEVLCRESAQAAQQATETQKTMDQHYKVKWRQAEADLNALCQSNSAQVQSLASKLHETNSEHQELRTAHERQLRLEAQTLRETQQQEQQTAQMTQEHEYAIQELRRQAEEQPVIQKTVWKRQLSQQSTYKAETHELYAEMLNMREKSEMQSHLAANVCMLEHSVPSRSVESEPENVLNTRSPRRCSKWILPEELETPNRPTSSGLQSPVGVPVQLGPSPQTRILFFVFDASRDTQIPRRRSVKRCCIRLEAAGSYEIDGVVLPYGSRQKRASNRLVLFRDTLRYSSTVASGQHNFWP